MCTMVSIFVTTPADIDALEAWSDDCGVRRRRYDLPAPARGVVVLGTAGMCDCGVPIGAGPRADDVARAEHKERAMRQRGWSEAKIRRAIAQSGAARQRQEVRDRELAVGSLVQWATFLAGAPGHARVRSVGLFSRRDGDLLSAPYWRSAPHRRVALASVEPLTLARLDEGVLYEFVGAR